MINQETKAYLEGYNGEQKKYCWSSVMAEAYFLGQACKKAGFPAASKITKSRGSSYRFNDGRTIVKIEYDGSEMACDLDVYFGRAFYEAA